MLKTANEKRTGFLSISPGMLIIQTFSKVHSALQPRIHAPCVPKYKMK